jgi:hypothetical protein
MVVVRGERTEVAGTKLVTLTLAAFNDKPALEQYRKAAKIITGGGDYDENYLANPFVARFVNIKFFDNTLSYKDPESVTSKIQPPVSPEFLQYFPETT